jgi:hypothetical protein
MIQASLPKKNVIFDTINKHPITQITTSGKNTRLSESIPFLENQCPRGPNAEPTETNTQQRRREKKIKKIIQARRMTFNT